ncbi:nuclear transport factor 2 family protein [Shewanella sp. cp20]|uniref:nuclear transport factor 2 family protein n=1 Tax=Shewanella sp. cp20 TaxID=1521167 RepID=UPI0005ADCD87|nr:nuclear transport factor 2 family protein [Shewanella sp. cp20]KIO35400.1 hypothetical protein DB48_16995 [Shewanella sp. cp20]
MKKGYWLFLSPALFVSQTSLAVMSESEIQIREVIEQFRTSIISKDKEVFSSLFFSDEVPFIAVFSDEMLASKRLERPKYPAAVNLGKFGPPANLISENDEQEEKIWNIKVQTDGHLASVHFDYSDHENGKKKAWGSESWSMVKVDSDWKITSVSFTVTELESEE